MFQPTLPLRGATSRASARFITTLFQPTLPVRGATEPAHVRDIDVWFQPTLPLRGATPEGGRAVPHLPRVSTHAPLAGSDEGQIAPSQPDLVSTHAPLAGSDVRSGRLSLQVFLFQPTLPLRGATATANMFIDDGGFQPTLPLRGATLALAASLPPPMFQPTLPLRGATWWTGQRKSPRCRFNPRSPCGERPDDPTVVSRGVAVSTHAPLAGSDSP